MYYKFKMDVGLKETIVLLAWYLIAGLVAGFLNGVIGAIFYDSSPILVIGITAILWTIVGVWLFLFTIKFIVESIFILPASEYEKKQLIKEDKDN